MSLTTAGRYWLGRMPVLAGPADSLRPILKRMDRELVEMAESLNGESAEMEAVEVLFPISGFDGV